MQGLELVVRKSRTSDGARSVVVHEAKRANPRGRPEAGHQRWGNVSRLLDRSSASADDDLLLANAPGVAQLAGVLAPGRLKPLNYADGERSLINPCESLLSSDDVVEDLSDLYWQPTPLSGSDARTVSNGANVPSKALVL